MSCYLLTDGDHGYVDGPHFKTEGGVGWPGHHHKREAAVEAPLQEGASDGTDGEMRKRQLVDPVTMSSNLPKSHSGNSQRKGDGNQ